MNYYHSLVLMGSGSTTYGCGLLAAFRGHRFIITAGHVGRVAKSNSLWAIRDLKQTQTPAGGYKPIQVLQIYEDTSGTDLTVCKIHPESPGRFVQIDHLKQNEVVPGSNIKAIGYPVYYVESRVKANIEDALFPTEIDGQVTNSVINELLNGGKPMRIDQGVLAAMHKPMDPKGFSGGLVTTSDYQPAGILIGGSEEDNTIVFTPFVKVIKLLEAASNFITRQKSWN